MIEPSRVNKLVMLVGASQIQWLCPHRTKQTAKFTSFNSVYLKKILQHKKGDSTSRTFNLKSSSPLFEFHPQSLTTEQRDIFQSLSKTALVFIQSFGSCFFIGNENINKFEIFHGSLNTPVSLVLHPSNVNCTKSSSVYFKTS